MTHSPSPWVLQKLTDNHNGYEWPTFAIRSKHGNHCIAVVGEVDRATAKRNEFNATVMVSAPALFAAAELVAEISDYKLETLTHSQLVNLVRDCRSECQRAVAKAKGE